MPVRLERELPRRSEAAPRARQLLAEALRADGSPGPDPALPLVVTELVANAVRHGRGSRFAFRVHVDGERVLVEVENRCWTMRPRRRLRTSDRPSGRGLALIAALSTSWGVTSPSRGRTWVWAELALGAPGVVEEA